MKKSLSVVVKALVVIVLFTGSVFTLSTAGVETVSEAKAAVSYEAVYQYLLSRGYQVITLTETSAKADENWVAHTVLQGVHYTTTVIVQGTQIIGNTDVPL